MPATGKGSDKGLKREAPPTLIAAAIVLALCAVGVGVFYFVNNGWQTQGQKEYFYYHEFLPLRQLDHGDRRPFDAENELRKRDGKPLLVAPTDKKGPKVSAAQVEADRQALIKLYNATHPQAAAH